MVLSGNAYSVIVERGSFLTLGSVCQKAVGICRALLVSDSHVAPLYLEAARFSLEQAGFTVDEFTFPAGEEHKNLHTVEKILNRAAEFSLTRSDVMVALGGGVVGDTVGFAASVYLRGIRFVSVPTSLLAMVDSSVGGKTGVDLPLGKNLIGAFHSPSAVLCDPDLLATLPAEQYAGGMAEVIKIAFSSDSELFEKLESNSAAIDDIIFSALRFKLDVVSRDPFDRNERRILNFGHTVGHALEVLSDYQLLHGQAVALGMLVITKASEQRGICPPGLTEKLTGVLVRYGLEPALAPAYTLDKIISVVTHDKKRLGDIYSVVLPTEIGGCKIVSMSENELYDFLKGGIPT